MNLAIDENCVTYTHHPTTNYCFADLDRIPNFDDYKKFVVDLHRDILHHDFVSWDVAVGIDGQPVFIEANFAGATWLYQLAAQRPLFGELTEEILQYVSRELEKGTSRDIKKSRGRKRKGKRKELNEKIKRIESKNKKLKKRNRELRLKLKEMESELEHAKHQYIKIKSSRSWRYTLILRRLGKVYKNIYLRRDQ